MFWHTHTLARSRFSRTYTRGIWRGGYIGIVEHEYQEHSPRPSRPALFYVACDSSIPVHSYAAGLPRIDRKTETNRERNGWVDRSSMNTFRSSNAYVICCSCLRDVWDDCAALPAAHYFPRMKTVADAVRYETFSLMLANIFTAIRIWNTYYETTEIVFASHYRVEIVNIHLFDLRLLWWIHFVKAIYPCLRYTMALLLSEFKDQCRSILCSY